MRNHLNPDAEPTAGWPRPTYHLDTHDGKPVPLYAQWISSSMIAQIFSCDTHRTYTAGSYNLCSNCAHAITRGVVLDWRTLRDQGHKHPDGPPFDVTDSGYGSPFCYVCALFALKHCPWFKSLDKKHGEQLPWLVLDGVHSYREIDTTTVIDAVNPDQCPHITTADLRAEIHAGNRYTLPITADDLPPLKHPTVYDREWDVNTDTDPRNFPNYDDYQHKYTPDEVIALAASHTSNQKTPAGGKCPYAHAQEAQ